MNLGSDHRCWHDVVHIQEGDRLGSDCVTLQPPWQHVRLSGGRVRGWEGAWLMSVTGWWRVCVPTHPSCHRHSQWLHQFVAIIPSIGKNGEKRGAEDWRGGGGGVFCCAICGWFSMKEWRLRSSPVHVCKFSVAKVANVMVFLTVLLMEKATRILHCEMELKKNIL